MDSIFDDADIDRTAELIAAATGASYWEALEFICAWLALVGTPGRYAPTTGSAGSTCTEGNHAGRTPALWQNRKP